MKNIIIKINECFDSGAGVFGSITFCFGAYFAGYRGMFMMLTVGVLLDTVWGITAQITEGKFALSDLARNSIPKLLGYYTLFVLGIFVETCVGIEEGKVSAILVGYLLVIEAWSICANLLIVNPNLPAIRLLKPALKGEISRKLNISPEEVENALNIKQSNRQEKNKRKKS